MTTGTRQYFETSTMRMPETTFGSTQPPSSTGMPLAHDIITERGTTEGVTETEGMTTGTRQYFETSTMRMPETTFGSTQPPSSTVIPIDNDIIEEYAPSERVTEPE